MQFLRVYAIFALNLCNFCTDFCMVIFRYLQGGIPGIFCLEISGLLDKPMKSWSSNKWIATLKLPERPCRRIYQYKKEGLFGEFQEGLRGEEGWEG